MTSTTLDTLALLALPTRDTLSEQQIRGSHCIWDGITLAPATAVDLGPRRIRRAGSHIDWYPRACRRCTSDAAFRALHRHVPECGDRGEEITCPVCRGLLRLIREGHGR